MVLACLIGVASTLKGLIAPILQDFQVSPRDRFEDIWDDIGLALLEKLLPLKGWIYLHNLSQRGRELGTFEHPSKDILHLVCNQSCPPRQGTVTFFKLHPVVDELVHDRIAVFEVLPAL